MGSNKKYPPFKRKGGGGSGGSPPTNSGAATSSTTPGGTARRPESAAFPATAAATASSAEAATAAAAAAASPSKKQKGGAFMSSIQPPQAASKKPHHGPSKKKHSMPAAKKHGSGDDIDQLASGGDSHHQHHQHHQHQHSTAAATTTPKGKNLASPMGSKPLAKGGKGHNQQHHQAGGGGGPKFSFTPTSPGKNANSSPGGGGHHEKRQASTTSQHLTAAGGNGSGSPHVPHHTPHRRSLKFVVSEAATSPEASAPPKHGTRFGHGRKSFGGSHSRGGESAGGSSSAHHNKSAARGSSVKSTTSSLGGTTTSHNNSTSDLTFVKPAGSTKKPLHGMAFALPQNAEPVPSKFSFAKAASERSVSPSGGDQKHQKNPSTPSLSFQFNPSMVAASRGGGSSASPDSPASGGNAALPFLDLGASADGAPMPSAAASVPTAALGTRLVWLCESCGKGQDFTPSQVGTKTWVRSECGTCAKKRTFIRSIEPAGPFDRQVTAEYCDPSGAPATVTVTAWICDVCGKEKQLSGPHLDGKEVVRSDCWPCAKKRMFSRRTRDVPVLTPQQLQQQQPQQHGSFALAASIGVPLTPPLAPSTAPGGFPYTLLHSSSDQQLHQLPSPQDSPCQDDTAIPPFAGAAARMMPSLIARKADPDECDFYGDWSEVQFLRHVLRLRSTLLQVRSGAIPPSTSEDSHPLGHLFAPPLAPLSNDGGGVRVFFGADGAIYAMRHDLRYFVKGSSSPNATAVTGGGGGRGGASPSPPCASYQLEDVSENAHRHSSSTANKHTNGSKSANHHHHHSRAISTEHLALLAQIAVQAETLASTRSKRIGNVFCNNSMTFAALSAYFAVVGSEDSSSSSLPSSGAEVCPSVKVYGPARDHTVKSGTLDSIAAGCSGLEVVVSVDAKMAAVKRVHRQSGFVVTPNGATAAAIRQVVDQKKRAEASSMEIASGSSAASQQLGCVPLVLLGKVAPWDDDDSPMNSPSL